MLKLLFGRKGLGGNALETRRIGVKGMAGEQGLRIKKQQGNGLLRLALPQAGLLPSGSPDAPDENLEPGTWTETHCSAGFTVARGGDFTSGSYRHLSTGD
jgi:hypothetical protein